MIQNNRIIGTKELYKKIVKLLQEGYNKSVVAELLHIGRNSVYKTLKAGEVNKW